MGTSKVAALGFAGALSAGAVLVAHMKAAGAQGDAGAGRAFALTACTGCHAVAADQRFAPVYTGPPAPPDFKTIANRPNTTAASLRHILETLPAVPQHGEMANPLLSPVQLQDVVAFIMTLRATAEPAQQPKTERSR